MTRFILANAVLFISAIASISAHAQSASNIFCMLTPRLYVENVYLKMNTVDRTFEFCFDNMAGKNIVTVKGELYNQGKDSMGFDKFDLCTAEPCSGPTYLGEIKAADSASENDRVSYVSINSEAISRVSYERFGRKLVLQGLAEMACSYQ